MLRAYLFSYFPKCLLRCSFLQTNFLAISAVFYVSIIDLYRIRQLFRRSFFLLRDASKIARLVM